MSLSASWSGTKRMETLPTATRGITENRVGPNRYDASRACRATIGRSESVLTQEPRNRVDSDLGRIVMTTSMTAALTWQEKSDVLPN